MLKYMVVFGETQQVLTGEQLIDFVKTSVVNNKDINNFQVVRIRVKNN